MCWLFWELLFSIFCMLCKDKGSSLNLDFMVFGNFVVIMIMLMSIYVYMYVCMYVCCFLTVSLEIMIVYANAYMYVCMELSDRVVKDHACGRTIIYAGEWKK